MRNISKVLILVLCLIPLLSTQNVFTQDRAFMNPGLKFSHTFGEKGGYTFGIELSYTIFTSDGFYGFVVSTDYCQNAKRIKYHIGGEYMGLEIGPTYILESDTADFGFSTTPFIGVILIPYYSYTYRYSKNDLHEVGAFLKIPIAIKGKGFSLVD